MTFRMGKSAREIEKNGNRILEMQEKLHEASKRREAVESGEDGSLTGGKTERERLEEKVTQGRSERHSSESEAADAAKKAREIEKRLARETRTELENEISDITALRDEYKELIKTMLSYEKSKREKDAERIADLEGRLAEADAVAERRIRGGRGGGEEESSGVVGGFESDTAGGVQARRRRIDEAGVCARQHGIHAGDYGARGVPGGERNAGLEPGSGSRVRQVAGNRLLAFNQFEQAPQQKVRELQEDARLPVREERRNAVREVRRLNQEERRHPPQNRKERGKMRNLIVLAAFAAAYAMSMSAAAAEAVIQPPPELAGFRIGQRFDFTNETFCAEMKMTGQPAKDLEKFSGFTCWSTVPRDGFDIVHILVTKKMRVIEIYASCECKDDAAAKEKRDELKAELLKKYGSRISDDPNYTFKIYDVDGNALVILSESDLRKAYSAEPERNPVEGHAIYNYTGFFYVSE